MISADILFIFDQTIMENAALAMAIKVIRIAMKRCFPPKKTQFDMCDRKKQIINVTNPLQICSCSLQFPFSHSAESKVDPALYPIRKNHINEIKFKSHSAGIILDGSSLYIVSYGLSQKILTSMNIIPSAAPKIIPVKLKILFCLQDDLPIYPPTN